MDTKNLRVLLNDYYSSSQEHLEEMDDILRTKGVVFRVTGMASPKKNTRQVQEYLNDLIFHNISNGQAKFLQWFFRPEVNWKVQWINNYHQVTLEYEIILDFASVVENKWLHKSGGQECFIRFIKLNSYETNRNFLYDKAEHEKSIKSSILAIVNNMMHSGGIWSEVNLQFAHYFLRDMGSKNLSSQEITAKNLPDIVYDLELPFEYKDVDIWGIMKSNFYRYSRILEASKVMQVKPQIIKKVAEWEKEQAIIKAHQLKLLSRANL